jgi:hypothetical protein
MGVKRVNDGYDEIYFRPTKRMKLNHAYNTGESEGGRLACKMRDILENKCYADYVKRFLRQLLKK